MCAIHLTCIWAEDTTREFYGIRVTAAYKLKRGQRWRTYRHLIVLEIGTVRPPNAGALYTRTHSGTDDAAKSIVIDYYKRRECHQKLFF